jgi:hypothetical protein
MPESFSPFVIEALVQVISGGAGLNNPEPPIGVYRSGPEIDGFLMGCGIQPVSAGSRLPSLRASLRAALQHPDADNLIRRAVENVADPRHHTRDPDATQRVLDHLNANLEADGFEVAILNGRAILRRRGGSVLIDAFAEKSASLDFDTVSREIDRALRNAEHDPEDAVTAACSTLEAVCRSILVELDLPIPDKKDIAGLVRAVQEPLNLSPGRSDLPKEIAEDVRQILGGLTTAARGIGALRTHGGDAHGRERGRRAVDARIARLAIHAASTVALFLIETWEHQQKRQLPNREAST